MRPPNQVEFKVVITFNVYIVPQMAQKIYEVKVRLPWEYNSVLPAVA